MVGVVVRGQKVKVNGTGQILQGTVREHLLNLGKLATEGNLGEQGLENKTIRAFAEGKQELGALIGQGQLDLVGALVATQHKQEASQALAPSSPSPLHKRGVVIHAIKSVFVGFKTSKIVWRSSGPQRNRVES